MAAQTSGNEPHICEVLRRIGKTEWSFSALNNTLYTDLNETFTADNLVIHIIRNMDAKLVPAVEVILKSNAGKPEKVRRIVKAFGGYTAEEFRAASYIASKEVALLPEIEHALPYVYPARIAFFTRIPQTSAVIYVRNKICPLYYQNAPEGSHEGKIAVVGTLYGEKNRRITGDVIAVPDYYDRTVMQLVDIMASLESRTSLEQEKMDAVRKLTNYPISQNGINYRF